MGTTFIPAGDDARALLDELIGEYRKDLAEHGVTITLLFALADKEGKPAMRHRGQVVAGWCKVNAYAERVEGKADATICLDGDRWGKWSEARRRALVHHELMHIGFCDGKLDALERPVLKARPGDWHFDGFHDVLGLYGNVSFEFTNLQAIAERHRQGVLPFAMAPAPAVEIGIDRPEHAEVNAAFPPAEDPGFRAPRRPRPFVEPAAVPA